MSQLQLHHPIKTSTSCRSEALDLKGARRLFHHHPRHRRRVQVCVSGTAEAQSMLARGPSGLALLASYGHGLRDFLALKVGLRHAVCGETAPLRAYLIALHTAEYRSVIFEQVLDEHHELIPILPEAPPRLSQEMGSEVDVELTIIDTIRLVFRRKNPHGMNLKVRSRSGRLARCNAANGRAASAESELSQSG